MSKGVFILIVIVVGGLAIHWLWERLAEVVSDYFDRYQLEDEGVQVVELDDSDARLIQARREVDDFERWLDPRDTVDSWRP